MNESFKAKFEGDGRVKVEREPSTRTFGTKCDRLTRQEAREVMNEALRDHKNIRLPKNTRALWVLVEYADAHGLHIEVRETPLALEVSMTRKV